MRSPREFDPVGMVDAGSAAAQPLTLLLVEDDRADALLVEELIADVGADLRMLWAPSMAHAESELAGGRANCVLLDLQLPDATGIEALRRVTDCDPTVPVIVLTGLNDEHIGVSAVAAGAQDYLVKGRVEPDMLRRALLYAVERKRAELTAADLRVSQLRAQENARLERGLLPSPLLCDDPGIDVVTQYRPSRQSGFLSGDFYDVVQTPDRTVHLLIGDVSGHGPEEAALGVALRIAWRTLVFAGVNGTDRMRQLDRVLRVERAGRTFATVLSVSMHPDHPHISTVRAGHPGLVLHSPASVEWIEPPGGQPLGVRSHDWPQHELELPPGHGLLLLTDGLFEGHSGAGNRRLGEDGLLALARSLAALPGREFVAALIDAAEQRAASHGGLADDIAVVRVERTSG